MFPSKRLRTSKLQRLREDLQREVAALNEETHRLQGTAAETESLLSLIHSFKSLTHDRTRLTKSIETHLCEASCELLCVPQDGSRLSLRNRLRLLRSLVASHCGEKPAVKVEGTPEEAGEGVTQTTGLSFVVKL